MIAWDGVCLSYGRGATECHKLPVDEGGAKNGVDNVCLLVEGFHTTLHKVNIDGIALLSCLPPETRRNGKFVHIVPCEIGNQVSTVKTEEAIDFHLLGTHIC